MQTRPHARLSLSDDENDERPQTARSLSSKRNLLLGPHEEEYTGPQFTTMEDFWRILSSAGVNVRMGRQGTMKSATIGPELVAKIIDVVDAHVTPDMLSYNITADDHPVLYDLITSLVGEVLYVDDGPQLGFTVTRYNGCQSPAAQYVHCDHPYGIDPGTYVEGYHFPRQMAFIATLSNDETNCLTQYWTGPEFTLTNFTPETFKMYMNMMHMRFTQVQGGQSRVTYARPSRPMEHIINAEFKREEPLAKNTLSNLPYFHFHVGPQSDDTTPRYFLRARYVPSEKQRPPLTFVPENDEIGRRSRGSTQPRIRSRRSRVKRRKSTRRKASPSRRSRRRMIRRSISRRTRGRSGC